MTKTRDPGLALTLTLTLPLRLSVLTENRTQGDSIWTGHMFYDLYSVPRLLIAEAKPTFQRQLLFEPLTPKPTVRDGTASSRDTRNDNSLTVAINSIFKYILTKH